MKNAHAYAAKQNEKSPALGQREIQRLIVCETSIDHLAYAPDVPLFDARRVRALENLIGIVEINATSDLKNTLSANFVIKFKKSVTKDKNVDGCIASELTERTHGPRV